jgi:predicted transcriptional regulator
MKRVREVMTVDVLSLRPEMPLLEAARALRHRQVGGAPVCSPDGHVVGVMSKSDLTDFFGLPCEALRVADAMNRTVVSVSVDDTVDDAHRALVRKGVHRLVVIDANGRLAGVLSALDLVRQLCPPDPSGATKLEPTPRTGDADRPSRSGKTPAIRLGKRQR